MGLNACIQRALCLFATSVLALWADAPHLAITEIHSQLPTVKVYLDILDSNGQPPVGLTAAGLSASLNSNPLSVSSVKAFKDAGETIAYLFVIDISKSIAPADFGQMQEAVIRWISSLRPGDRAAVASFGNTYRLVQGFTSEKDRLIEVVTGLSVQDNTTHLYDAIKSSIDAARQGDSSATERRIVLIASDGNDEGSNLTDQQLIAQLQTDSLPLYTIGYASAANTKRQGLDVLRHLSEASGGMYAQSIGHGFDKAFASIKDAIFRVFEVDLSCEGCTSGNKENPLEITLVSSGQKIAQPVQVSPPGSNAIKPIPSPSPSQDSGFQKIPGWLYAVGGVALAILLLFLFIVAKVKGKPPLPANIARPEVSEPPVISQRPVETPEASPAGNGIPMQLAVVSGRDRGRIFRLRLEGTLVIGRAPDCDVVLDDPRIANRHCEVLLARNVVLVQPLDSKNRVYLSGVEIKGRRKLENDDSLLLGETEVRLRF